MSSRAILEEAHAKIQMKQYEEARRLLLKIPSHPTAAKWITKIDRINTWQIHEEKQPVVPVAKPPRKTSLWQRRTASPVHALLPMTVLLVGIFLLMSTVGGNALGGIMSPPETYQDQHITVTHGWGWQPQNVDAHGWCYVQDCLYYIKSRPNVGLLFTYTELEESFSSAELADSRWYGGLSHDLFEAGNRNVQETIIGGLPAVAQTYSLSEHDRDGGEFFMLDIFIADDQDGYMINVFAGSACELADKIGDINTVLSSLRIAAEDEVVLDDGYTAPSPVELTVPGCVKTS